MKFALQDSLLQHGGDYRQAFRTAMELGYDGVEITFFGKPLDDEATGAIHAASQAAGIPVSAVCGGYAHWIGDFEKDKRLQAVEDIKASLRQIAALGGGGLIAPAAYGMFTANLPPYTAPRSRDEDDQALTDSLQRIAEGAEACGVTFYLEPLNRYEDHMVNTADKAAALAGMVGSDRVRVMVDTYHMNIEESDPLASVVKHYSEIGYYHLSDSNRFQPGKGHIDFSRLLTFLKEKGYNGFLSLECRLDGERRDSLRDSLQIMKACLKGAAASPPY